VRFSSPGTLEADFPSLPDGDFGACISACTKLNAQLLLYCLMCWLGADVAVTRGSSEVRRDVAVKLGSKPTLLVRLGPDGPVAAQHLTLSFMPRCFVPCRSQSAVPTVLDPRGRPVFVPVVFAGVLPSLPLISMQLTLIADRPLE
jgi:hypothetical protein